MKSRLVGKFLGAYLPLILFAMIILNFFVSFSLRGNFERRITEQLYSNSILVGDILKEDIKKNNQTDLQKQVSTLGERLNVRITVIKNDGHVIADSLNDPRAMSDHSDRPEVIQATTTGRGEATRFSETLNYNMQYIAVSLYEKDRHIAIIRLAMALREMDALVRVIYREVLVGGIIATILMASIGYYISKSITNPIVEMQNTAERISAGDFSRKVRVRSHDELGALAKSLNIMSEKLQGQIERLKKADKVRTDFVANVSHELKTPLTSIKGYIETLQDGALDDKENAVRFLNIIKKNADSLTHIVDDLLSLSEVELGKDRLHTENVNLKVLIEETVLGFGHALKGKKICADIKTQGDEFVIRADKAKINQVFVNIIDNAVKYSEEGGQIVLTLSRVKEHIEIAIADKGIGIPEKYTQRVFERFYRVDKARSRAIGGTGLGLSIAKHIVALHNGEIWLTSIVGQGTTVTVRFPAVNVT